MGEFGGRKGKGEIVSLYYNLKMKGNLKKYKQRVIKTSQY